MILHPQHSPTGGCISIGCYYIVLLYHSFDHFIQTVFLLDVFQQVERLVMTRMTLGDDSVPDESSGAGTLLSPEVITRLGGAGDLTSNLPVTRQPAVPPVPHAAPQGA